MASRKWKFTYLYIKQLTCDFVLTSVNCDAMTWLEIYNMVFDLHTDSYDLILSLYI